MGKVIVNEKKISDKKQISKDIEKKKNNKIKFCSQKKQENFY